MLRDHAKVREDESLRMLSQGTLTGMRRLQSIIDNILDVSKLDSAVLEVRKVPASIVVLIKEIEAGFKDALEERRLQFRTHGLSDLPFIMADGDLLYRAFYQLIMNAIKYTPDGGQITVSGREIQDDGGQKAIEIVIADTGIGIDEEFHELIFEKFYQTGQVMLHSSGATKFKGGGPGLGLAIAKGAIAVHGGKVWVESQGYDEENLPGSRFHVQLPLTEWREANELERA
jgi:signal transduction histidine kinase